MLLAMSIESHTSELPHACCMAASTWGAKSMTSIARRAPLKADVRYLSLGGLTWIASSGMKVAWPTRCVRRYCREGGREKPQRESKKDASEGEGREAR